MNANKEKLIKLSLYLPERLKQLLDVGYELYAHEVKQSELKVRPLSYSKWLTSIIESADFITEPRPDQAIASGESV
tara:strand:- start:129 stop:356 length:228 start_codon:yes stop_codon:yes gene_type:complete